MIHRPTAEPHGNRKDFENIKRLFPYIWDFKGRVFIALACLILSKVAIVGMPLVLKDIVDSLDSKQLLAMDNLESASLAIPLVLLLAYGALRLMASLFNELRDAIFARVRYHAMRGISRRVLNHLYTLSLSYHLDRKTGGITRDLERGTNSLSSILNYLVFNIFPTAAEFIFVAIILLGKYEPHFALITFATVAIYISFTLLVTNWRMHYRHEMNKLESQANSYAVDGMLNYETVKYFTNEDYELKQYDETLDRWEGAAVKSQTSMSLLNFGQGAVIAVGVTLMMIYAAQGVVDGEMTLGDLVLVNTMMLQLFIPLNFLGIIYRALKYALADMDMMLKLLDTEREVKDVEQAKQLTVSDAVIRFDKVCFDYNDDRKILHEVSFDIPHGHKVAVVGPSGAGKSTLARLLFRFYDVDSGAILIDGQNISSVSQSSLRDNIGIVPQDTVLFNDTIDHNIRYARLDASDEQIQQAAKHANIHDFIIGLPDGYQTVVGERGLKLSGGEKQRVAIARVILKNPRILVFDEATSSLDSQSEQMILESLKEIAEKHTTLVIAHRLSTIIDADDIVVLDKGRVVEQGTHQELLEREGMYAHLWKLQQEEEKEKEITV
ncbi:MAG: ABC transporter ATP-binding protein/permease [Gammaproteobacteria bacterium]|nr:ABC transporter ATP-binding protein/permease [Gammaproteobacteria bacterium]NNJ49013.1 ABC transporter ATP-binding protein/permease [Gammaproteobacteria bacterium]